MRDLLPWRLLLAALMLLLVAGPAAAQEEEEKEEVLVVDSLSPKKGRLAARLTPFADGLVREGSWSPLFLQLANGGGPLDVSLSATEFGANFTTESYSRTVELPEGGRKDATLYVRTGSRTGTRSLEVRGDPQRSGVIEYPARMLRNEDVGIAVIGVNTLGLPAIQETWTYGVPSDGPRPHATSPRQVRTGIVPEVSMPDRAIGWGAVDWVVWPEPDPGGVSDAQLHALLGWVASGGHLLVTVTDSYPRLAGTELAHALPVAVTGVEDVSDIGRLFQALALRPPAPTTVPVAQTTLVQDGRHTEVLATIADTPAWVVGTYGLGTVHVLTVDPTRVPFTQVTDTADIWRPLLWLPAPEQSPATLLNGTSQGYWDPTRQTPSFDESFWIADPTNPGLTARARARLTTLDALDIVASEDCMVFQGMQHPALATHWSELPRGSFEAALRSILSDIPGVAPLPLSWLIAFAGIYLFVIGPLDYYALRLLKRQPLTWVTFPVSIAVFSAIALVGTSYTKGSQAVMTHVEVVDVLPGTPYQRGVSWFGIFATSKNEVVVRSDYDEGLTTPLGDGGFMSEPSISSSEASGELHYLAQTWSLAYGESGWVRRGESGHVEVEKLESGTYAVTSRLPVTLRHAQLRLDGREWTIGTLDPDASVTATFASLPATTDPRIPQLYELTADFFDDAMGGHLHEALIIGVLDEPVDSLKVEGLRPSRDTITIYRVPVRIEP